MDVKALIDGMAVNAQPIGVVVLLISLMALLVRTRLAKRLWAGLEDTMFSNWQLALLGATGLVLSAASGWTTWDGMRNFTGEPLLSGMITFGIQGVMLIVAWLIGESFATGMNTRSQTGKSGLVSPQVQTWLGAGIGVLLFVAGLALVMQWTGQADIRQASTEDLSWARTGDKLLIFAFGLLLVAMFVLYAASDIVKPYLQGARVMLRNSVLWVMFLACMATSVFFSFDSLFSAIFPQDERVRAAELRAQNQVGGIVTDISEAIAVRQGEEAERLLAHEAWRAHDGKLNALATAAAESEGAIERYINDQIEERRRGVKEQQERMSSAQAGQAGLAAKKISLTEEKSRLAAQRPELVAEYTDKKSIVDDSQKAVDAKRVEALAEQKGVEGTGKEGRGPVYRQLLGELNKMQETAKIADERLKDAQKRLGAVETRLTAIDRELATIDGDLAKLKGEAETAEQRISIAQENVSGDTGPKLDPARLLPDFDRAKTQFLESPTSERLASLQSLCTDIQGAMSATPETKDKIAGIDCDTKSVVDAAGSLFALQSGIKLFAATCVGGDKLVANTTADQLYAFARKCLADSGLPSKETEALRTKINGIELARDDKAHRFVVTWNAFSDGNRLAYLALAIAIAIDSLIFMSGLFGANAVRSPLSDVPTNKARSGAQLEATINAALGPHPYDTAWLALNALRPMTYADGFSAMVDLSQLDKPTADRIRMVLTAGADIGAVETLSVNPERYRVRSELREYLSTVCEKHFKTDAGAKERARLEQLVGAALAPHPREHAEIVLHTLEPIRETEGFTSQVSLNEITDDYELRLVRRVMNAGAAVKAVAPDLKIDDRYYVRPALYETLLAIRATAPASLSYDQERGRLLGNAATGAINAGLLQAAREEIAENKMPRLEQPKRALPERVGPPPFTAEQQKEWSDYFRSTLLNAINLDAADVEQRLSAPGLREAMLGAWRALNAHAKKNDLLDRLLRGLIDQLGDTLGRAYSKLKGEADGDDRKVVLLEAVDNHIQNELTYYLLLPDLRLIDNLILEMETAAQFDDGLRPDEEALRERLKVVQASLGRLDLTDPMSWSEIKQGLLVNDATRANILRMEQRKFGGQS